MKVNELLTIVRHCTPALVDVRTDYFITDNLEEMLTQYGDKEVKEITASSNRLYISVNYMED